MTSPKYILVILAILLGLASCTNPKSQAKGGIIFSFDDNSIEEWHAILPLLDAYSIKATFFISMPQTLNEEQWRLLKAIEDKGHEIGCHSLNHLNAAEFDSIPTEYLRQEVLPALQILKEKGFDVTSFAYPFGNSTKTTDSILKQEFSFIRKANWNYLDTTLNAYNSIFISSFHPNLVTDAMGLDNNYNINLNSFESAIIRAVENKEVVVFYAHIPNNSNLPYTINPIYLEELFGKVAMHNIKSLTPKELKTFFKRNKN